MKLVLYKPLLRRQYHLEYRYYLGFGYLKAYLAQHLPEVEVEIAPDAQRVRAAAPDVVGFSTVTEMWPHVCDLYRRLREWFDGPVLFGGPHITALPQLLPRGNNIAFMGEGELALKRVLEALLAGAALPGIDRPAVPGIAVWNGDRLLSGPPTEFVEIDSLPPPADAPTDVFPLTTVRGCPFHCTHCVEHATQGRPRQMSAERLAALVIERHDRFGTTVFEMLDDVFLVSPRRLTAFVDILDRRGLLERLEFIRVSLMAHLITDEVAQTLARMNLRLAGMGVESADPEILRRFKDGVVTRAHLERAIQACTNHGVGIGSSMVLGYPGETERQMRNTIDFYAEKIHKTSFEYWETYVCQPLPGSTLWNEGLRAGRLSPNMDFSTLRIDADVAHFDTPWYYDNEHTLPRERFLGILREYDLIRAGFFVRDAATIVAQPRTDVFVRQYVPAGVARRMTLQTLRAWKAADGRPIAVFGAGKHTRKIMPALVDSPVRIAALADDNLGRVGARMGPWKVVSTYEMLSQDIGAVLISSDMRQDELATRLRPLIEAPRRLLTIYQSEELSRRAAAEPVLQEVELAESR
ncbi:MAG: radical SAM protein [Planctomycetes bacterium]|nr:radical SAM protein [Planctomycetota bacterium]